LSQQGTNIYSQLSQSERYYKNGNIQLKDKLAEAKMETSRWQQEVIVLKK